MYKISLVIAAALILASVGGWITATHETAAKVEDRPPHGGTDTPIGGGLYVLPLVY